MKKILILHHVSSQGGGTKSLVDMAVMLAPKYDVVVCIPKGSSRTIKLLKEHAINYYEVKTPIPSLNVYSGSPGYINRYFLSSAFRFRRNKELIDELLRLEPDAIFYNTSVTSLIAKDVPSRIMNVCIVRETFIKSPFTRIIKKNFEDKFQGVAYIAEHEKKFLNLNNPKQIVIPDCLDSQNGSLIDINKAKEMCGIPKEKYCLLFLGGTIQIKGLDVLLRAVDKLSDDYIAMVGGEVNQSILNAGYIIRHFYRVAYVRYLIDVKRLLHKLENEKKIILIGYTREIEKYMSATDVVVFPSTKAHQPRPCIEAGFFHKPVILSDYKATAEYFEDHYNALTFKPKSAKDLERKIVLLREDRRLGGYLGDNNYKMSVQKHDFRKTQEKLKDFFDKILQ